MLDTPSGHRQGRRPVEEPDQPSRTGARPARRSGIPHAGRARVDRRSNPECGMRVTAVTSPWCYGRVLGGRSSSHFFRAYSSISLPSICSRTFCSIAAFFRTAVRAVRN